MHRAARALPLLILLASSCLPAETRGEGPNPLDSEAFRQYWFSGVAELNRYELEQARYGGVHPGHAVLIFVTEDFLPDRQVKADSPDRERTGAVPVLKLNATRKFETGIYPYSTMTSVFTPLDLPRWPRTLKSTTSVQEWCGHTWLQLNLRDGRYRVEGHSYFESEADRELELEGVWLEDELWTRIRLAPDSLPVGEVRIVPGSLDSRLRHREPSVERAGASLGADEGGTRTYSLTYPGSGRTLAIRFSSAFPHEILGWDETTVERGRSLTTRAVRTHVMRSDYWNHHDADDRGLRGELGLD